MLAASLSRYGAPAALQISEQARPVVGPGDVLIKVEAAAVTQGDRRLRAGEFPGITFLPGRLAIGITGPRRSVPGTVFAGTVAALGSEAGDRFAVGDRVLGSVMSGAHAEYLVVPADGPIARAPAGWSAAEAAVLPYSGETAHHFLRRLAGVQPGERVLIVGAAGGVGRMAVQLAAHMGAEVTAVCRAHEADRMVALGAHAVVLREAGSGPKDSHYDVILDIPGAWSGRRARAALRRGGRYLSPIVSVGRVLWSLVGGLLGGKRCQLGVALPDGENLDELVALAEAGAMRPVVQHRLPLTALSAAHALLESRGLSGDVVVEMPAVALRAVG